MNNRSGVRGIAAMSVALVLAVACGDDSSSDPGSSGGTAPDGSAGDGANGDDGGPIDPGVPGGGPTVLDFTCPKLGMPSAAGTVFVDANASGGGDGSQAAPFRTVAEAIGSGGVVWVAAGNYKENLSVAKNVAIYGGFAPGFGSRTDACATVIEAQNGSSTVLGVASSVKSLGLDGVTVKGGGHGISVSGDSSVGAMYTISNSVFANNGSPDENGGAMNLDRVSATISRTAFRDNHGARGAAISLYGEAATIAIDSCLFEKNIGHSDHGGALYLGPKSGTVVRSTFRGNEIGKDTGYGWGGGGIVYKGGATPVKVDFAYNVFTDNLASVGGGLFVDDGASATLSHDLFYRNRSIPENGVARGAALYVDGATPGVGSNLIADQITVVNNNYDASGKQITARGGGVYVETSSRAKFTNSIFWNNGDETFWGDPSCAIEADYTIGPSQCGGGAGCTIGTGVSTPSDVYFVDEAADDYHLKSTAGHFSKGAWVNDDVSSPAIDAADPDADASAEPAPNGGRANLGSFGRTTEASKSPGP